MSREGSLRTFLGTAPGVGKTYAMLAEGRRRAGNGERVVAGWIDWHGRARTREQLGDLEVIAPRTVGYRGTVARPYPNNGETMPQQVRGFPTASPRRACRLA